MRRGRDDCAGRGIDDLAFDSGKGSPGRADPDFERIADASSEMVSTNLPSGEVGRFMELALKARTEKISTVSLVPPAVNTGDPDMAEVHAMVSQGIDRSEGDAPAPKARKKKRPDPSSAGLTGGSLGSMSKGYVANQADDLGAAC